MVNRTTERVTDSTSVKPRKETERYIGEISLSKFPDDVLEKFNNEGYHLRWLRVTLEGKEDAKNIAQWFNKGYTFVTHDELKGTSFENTFDDDLSSRRASKPLVSYMDVALAKVSFDNRQRYIEEVEKKTRIQNASIQRFDVKGIRDSSRETSTTGRQPKFNDD